MELIHTCYRITDVDRSVAFYEALGFEERRRLPIREEAINVFMGLPGDGDRLELTYNFGVDSYELGTGYGHVAVTVDVLDATLERLAEQGIEPERPPYRVREGGSRLCFVRDPDGYRIELIDRSGRQSAALERLGICSCRQKLAGLRVHVERRGVPPSFDDVVPAHPHEAVVNIVDAGHTWLVPGGAALDAHAQSGHPQGG